MLEVNQGSFNQNDS